MLRAVVDDLVDELHRHHFQLGVGVPTGPEEQVEGDLDAAWELHGRLARLQEHRHQLQADPGVARLSLVLRLDCRPVFDDQGAQEQVVELLHQVRVVPINGARQLPVLRVRSGCHAMSSVRGADNKVKSNLG